MTTNTTSPYRLQDLLEHRPWVRGLARSLVRDENAADDLEQDTWARALDGPPTGIRSIRAWLATVMRNRLRDRHRSESRRVARETIVARPEATWSGSDLAERVEIHRLLISTVLELEPPARTAVLLRFFEGLSPAEIAQREGIPASTVRSRLARALAQLRTRLDDRHGGDDRRWRAALAPLLDGAPGPARRGVPQAVRVAIVALAVTAGVVGLGWVGARTGLWDGSGRDVASGGTLSSDSDADAAPPAAPPRPRRRSARRVEVGVTPAGERSAEPGGMTPVDDAGDDGAAAAATPLATRDGRIGILVVSASGEPVVGASVLVLDANRPGVPGRQVAFASAKTGDEGRASVQIVRAHRVRFSAHHGEHAALGPVIDLWKARPASVTLRLTPAARLRGRVVDADGSGVPGAGLELLVPGGASVEYGLSVPADARGEFRSRPLPVGLFEPSGGTLEVTAAGFQRRRVHVGRATFQQAELVVELEREITIAGRCVDIDGMPIAGVRVTNVHADGVATRAAGRFLVRKLDRLDVWLEFDSEDYVPRSLHVTPETARGGDVGDVVLTKGGTVRGVVTRPDGTPIPEAHVMVIADARTRIVRQGAADEAGRFEFRHVGEGTHSVVAREQLEGADWIAGARGRVEGVEATPLGASAEDVVVTVRPGHTVLVEFVRADDGKPLLTPRVGLTYQPVGVEGSAQHRSFHGAPAASLRLGIPDEGLYTLSLQVPGFEAFRVRGVQVRADAEVRVVARLTPVSGR